MFLGLSLSSITSGGATLTLEGMPFAPKQVAEVVVVELQRARFLSRLDSGIWSSSSESSSGSIAPVDAAGSDLLSSLQLSLSSPALPHLDLGSSATMPPRRLSPLRTPLKLVRRSLGALYRSGQPILRRVVLVTHQIMSRSRSRSSGGVQPQLLIDDTGLPVKDDEQSRLVKYVAWSAEKQQIYLLESDHSGVPVSLTPRGWDIISIMPVQTMVFELSRRGRFWFFGWRSGRSDRSQGMEAKINKQTTLAVQWAPLGLLNMMNGGGAVVSTEHTPADRTSRRTSSSSPDGKDPLLKSTEASPSIIRSSTFCAAFEVRGSGRMGVFTDVRPRQVLLDGESVDFLYQAQGPNQGLLEFLVPQAAGQQSPRATRASYSPTRSPSGGAATATATAIAAVVAEGPLRAAARSGGDRGNKEGEEGQKYTSVELRWPKRWK